MGIPLEGKSAPTLPQLEVCAGEFSKLLDSSPLLLWITDEEYHCKYVNQALLDFSGYTFEEGCEQKRFAFLHPEDKERILRNIQLFRISHTTHHQEYRSRIKNGKYLSISEFAIPRFSPEGNFIGYFGTLRDITGQKEQEENFKREHLHLQEEILKISEWERNRIGGDLHDTLSQVLLGVSLKSRLLEKKLQKKDLSEFYAAKEITSELSKIISTTRKLSQFLFPIALTKRDFLEALQDLAEQTRTLLGAQILFEFQDEGDSFESETALQLYRIIQEAVTNAVRHGGAKRIEVAFKTGYNGKRLLVIRDDGSGAKKFPSPNQGLGLHIMKYRAEAIGGAVEFGRNPEGGFVIFCHYTARKNPLARGHAENE